MMWSAVIWVCWISGVKSDGARRHAQSTAISSPVLPLKIRDGQPDFAGRADQ
jgi:hypothetical protein